MKKLSILSILLVAGICSCAKQDADSAEKGEIVLDTGQAGLVQSSNAVASGVLEEINSSDKSFVFSPISMDFALGMLASGTEGEALEELLSILSPDLTDVAQLNSYNKTLMEELPHLDKDVTLECSNLAVLNEMWHCKWLKSYKSDVSSFYKASFSSYNFGETPISKVAEQLNGWIKSKTGGKIDNVFSESSIKPSTLAYLINTILFKSSWQEDIVFKESATKYAHFFKSDGSIVTIPMMHTFSRNLQYHEDTLFKAIFLNLGNKAFDYVVLLPNEGHDVEELSSYLHGDGSTGISSESHAVSVYIPKMTIKNTVGMVEPLKRLGITKVFESGNLPKMTDPSGDKRVEDIFQNCEIEVNEHGLSAAAASIVQIGLSTANFSTEEEEIKLFRADRPFIFLIREKNNGIILFCGVYNGI